MKVSSARCTAHSKRAIIKISGLWLNEIGFESGNLIEVFTSSGKLVLKVCNEDGKSVLGKGSTFIQIRKLNTGGKVVPVFTVEGKWIENAGFAMGKIVLVQYEFGGMTIKVINEEALENLQ